MSMTITLGVDDAGLAIRFYEDVFGFAADPSSGVVHVPSGIRMQLRNRREIAADIGMAWAGRSPTEVVFGHQVETAEAIDAIVSRAVEAGARPVSGNGKPEGNGALARVRDLDGHVWEIRVAEALAA